MVKTIVTFLSELAFTYYMYMQYDLSKLKQKMFNYTNLSVMVSIVQWHFFLKTRTVTHLF